MATFTAKVKSVLSGDTVILTNAKGQERTLSLAYISAPRLKREGDEVCCGHLSCDNKLISVRRLLFNLENT